MFDIKLADKTTLNIINTYNSTAELKLKELKNCTKKTIFNKYALLLPKDVIESTDGINEYYFEATIFTFALINRSEIDKYINCIKLDENIQILNTDMAEIITYRQISTMSQFFYLKFYDFCDETLVVKCQCENSQSSKWEDTFVEILNSVEKIEDATDENTEV